MYYISYDNGEEEFVSKRMAFVFQAFGDMVSGDEKLFFYSGYSQYTRMVKNKPAGTGIWMYQAAVLLKCGKPHQTNRKEST